MKKYETMTRSEMIKVVPAVLLDYWGHIDIKHTKKQILEVGADIIDDLMIRLEMGLQCETALQDVIDKKDQEIENYKTSLKLLRGQMTKLIGQCQEFESQNNGFRQDKIRFNQLIEYQSRHINDLGKEVNNG